MRVPFGVGDRLYVRQESGGVEVVSYVEIAKMIEDRRMLRGGGVLEEGEERFSVGDGGGVNEEVAKDQSASVLDGGDQ